MSSVRLAYQCVYERSAEAARIVLDLCSEGYSTAKIAKIMAWNRRQIRDLLKSISEEVAAEVQIAEGTAGNWREIQHLLKSISEDLADEAEDGTGHGGLSDDEEAKALSCGIPRGLVPGRHVHRASRPASSREAAIAADVCDIQGNTTPVPLVRFAHDSTVGAACLGRSPILAADGAPAARCRLRCEMRWGMARAPGSVGVWLGDAMRASGACLHDALRASRRDRLTAGLKVALPSPAVRSLLSVAVDDPRWGSERAARDPGIRGGVQLIEITAGPEGPLSSHSPSGSTAG